MKTAQLVNKKEPKLLGQLEVGEWQLQLHAKTLKLDAQKKSTIHCLSKCTWKTKQFGKFQKSWQKILESVNPTGKY